MDENKNEEVIEESNAAKRLRLLGESMDEKIHSEEDEIKKGNRWQNIWYRYKWAIIIGIVLLITTVPIIVMCSRAEKEDVLVLYVGPVQIVEGATHNSIQSSLETVLSDYNDDGKRVLQIATHTIYPDGYVDKDGNGLSAQEAGKNQENLNNFTTQLRGSGEFVIVFIDKNLYDQKFKGIFEKYSSLGIDVPSEWMHDDSAIMLSETDFGSYYAGMQNLPDDTLIVINVRNVNHNDDEYDNQIDYIKKLLAYRKPTE